jgi:cellobiose-specific phosphotransferase system component IIC
MRAAAIRIRWVTLLWFAGLTGIVVFASHADTIDEANAVASAILNGES